MSRHLLIHYGKYVTYVRYITHVIDVDDCFNRKFANLSLWCAKRRSSRGEQPENMALLHRIYRTLRWPASGRKKGGGGGVSEALLSEGFLFLVHVTQ